MSGTLTICATPIGNLGDVSPRLTAALDEADVVYAEDTRRTGKLLASLGITTQLRSYFVGNEAQRAVELARRLSAGERVVLVSDAGTPVVADPGLTAVRAAAEVGATVTTIPGPSAVTALLSVTGFSGDRFVFEGFLPRKGSDRVERIRQIAAEARTVVFFSTGRRLHADLSALGELVDDDRLVVVGRELTKLHEEIWRGTVAESLVKWAGEARGEISVALAGARATTGSIDTAVTEALALIASGDSMADAVRASAGRHQIKKSDVYDEVLRARRSEEIEPG